LEGRRRERNFAVGLVFFYGTRPAVR
jgi:hypothetical protein